MNGVPKALVCGGYRAGLSSGTAFRYVAVISLGRGTGCGPRRRSAGTVAAVYGTRAGLAGPASASARPAAAVTRYVCLSLLYTRAIVTRRAVGVNMVVIRSQNVIELYGNLILILMMANFLI